MQTGQRSHRATVSRASEFSVTRLICMRTYTWGKRKQSIRLRSRRIFSSEFSANVSTLQYLHLVPSCLCALLPPLEWNIIFAWNKRCNIPHTNLWIGVMRHSVQAVEVLMDFYNRTQRSNHVYVWPLLRDSFGDDAGVFVAWLWNHSGPRKKVSFAQHRSDHYSSVQAHSSCSYIIAFQSAFTN